MNDPNAKFAIEKLESDWKLWDDNLTFTEAEQRLDARREEHPQQVFRLVKKSD